MPVNPPASPNPRACFPLFAPARGLVKYIPSHNSSRISISRVNAMVLSPSSEIRMRFGSYLLPALFIALASAATNLQNPDFESPPTNLPRNSNSAFELLIAGNNTIPGWTFDGTVRYVTAGPSIELPGNGHAIQLGQDGKINQTFIANTSTMNYILTFTLAPGDQNCSSNPDILVSAPDSRGVFSLKQHYGQERWESYGHYLGSWGDGEPINLVIQSQTSESDPNSTCWPIVDALLLKGVANLDQGNGNLLPNGGFESGPDFLSNSTEGALLDPVSSPVQSAIQQWAVLGTVKYIDSKHYFVPEGNAAIELVSGVSSGIQTASTLTEGSSYNLDFMLGDANDSCTGTFIIRAQAGSTVQNFTLQSTGTGSAKNFSMTFTADSSVTPISFLSYTSSQTKDGVFCGPVVDNVMLRTSFGPKPIPSKFTLCCLLFLVVILQFNLIF